MNLHDKVVQALNHIRPQLQADGGDVELIEIQDHRVLVRLKGACQGCPSAGATLKQGVLTAIKKEAPEINEVVDVSDGSSAKFPKPATDDPWAEQHRIEGVKVVLAVASGKGGVGKSTVAVNLALGLQHLNLRVGLLDADIYGPSAPTMLGVKEAPPSRHKKMEPAEAFGLKVISIGFFIPPDAPMIWRGPLIQKAITQFLHDVEWGELDCLVVDLPPGTGDAQLSLAQQTKVDGVIIVTTPSDVALVDVRRGLQMFNKIDVQVLGIVENMSFFICPHCGQRTNVFSAGGGRKTAADLNVPLLSEIPLDPSIRSAGDTGNPCVALDPASPQAVRFIALAAQVWELLTQMLPAWDKTGCHQF
ncbi:MAG: P-loop NTPase [Calditrichota bacterium]